MRCNQIRWTRLGLLLLVFVMGLAARSAEADDAGTHLFDWRHLPALPVAVEGAFVGTTDGVLVVAGGHRLEGEGASEAGEGAGDEPSRASAFSDAVFVLPPGEDQWRLAGRLDEPLAFGATASTGSGLLCMGGRGEAHLSSRVFLLRWNAKARAIRITRVADLPRPAAMLSAAMLRGKVYLVGGQVGDLDSSRPKKVFWSLDVSSLADSSRRGASKDGSSPGGASLPTWQSVPAWPGPACFCPIVVAQSDRLYVFGGSTNYPIGQSSASMRLLTDSYRFDPLAAEDEKWRRVAQPPVGLAASPAIAHGTSNILVFGGLVSRIGGDAAATDEAPAVGAAIRVYETITDTWTERGETPSPVAMTTAVARQGRIDIPGARTGKGEASSAVLAATPRVWQGSFHAIDYVVLAGYLLLLVWIGWHFAGRENSSNDFLLGGHRIPWWAAGLSILATQVSSIGFMAVPAKSFATNWVYFMGSLVWFIVVPIVVRYYIPFYRRLNITTAYEYLEHRFNLFVRLYGSCSFIVLQLGRMAIVLYLPAIALSVVTGMDVYASILVMGVLSTLYTVMGGIEAVVWTDVLQAGVLMSGAIIGAAIAIAGIDGGVGTFLDVARENAKFQMINWDLDVTTAAIWIVVLGNIFQRTADLTSDQAVVQRYLTTRDTRQSSRAVWASVAASIPWSMIVFFFGTALFVFFKTHPDRLNPTLQTDAIVPWFIVEEIPRGLSGLVIAALFAAAMSSLDSSIHSVATTLTVDFYKRFFPQSSDRSQLRLARWLTALLGALGTGAALLAATFEIESLWDLFLQFAGLTVGGLGGLFMLGIFTRRANGPGALVGAIASAVIMITVRFATPLHFFLYPVIGISSSFLVGYAASVLLPIQAKPLWGLTIHTPMESQSGHETS